MSVRFIDTTFRDGSQSLWAMGMRSGMMEAVAEAMDDAGFDAIEVPVIGPCLKKLVRDLKEDPWELARMLAAKVAKTPKACMAGPYIVPFEALPPRSLVELFYGRLAEIGVLNRVQVVCNTIDQTKRAFPWLIPLFKKLGLKIDIALSYAISPRHSDEYYVQKTREILPFHPDAIYLKDQGGLLTMDRARTLIPAIVQNADGVPVRLHSHCTTGLAPLVYLEALRSGVDGLYTAIPPLANGPSQPSVFSVARNARLLGYTSEVDETILHTVEERLTRFAREEGLPIGVPSEYDHGQYIHQIPGGVISNLKHQLAGLRIQHRLEDVLEESVRVRQDLGYPIMITPHSQFVVTQAAINVATGERYQIVIDELILFAQGAFGEDSGHTWMDQNLRDRLLGMPRARELATTEKPNVSLGDLRKRFGGLGASDEEFLLRYIMKGEEEIAAMRAAGPPKRYPGARQPLRTLLEELSARKTIRFVQVQWGSGSLTARTRSSP